jgi:glycosyltransferase involved in cell wall biosynthesis
MSLSEQPLKSTPDSSSANSILASIIIPTYNGGRRIGHCLDALRPQVAGRNIEIIVIDDGSTDDTAVVVATYPEIRLITQANAGPAAARNRGASAARGKLLFFTDDDCVPMPDWIDAMLAPFQDSQVVGVKGIYRTHQRSLAARFVQMEYEDKYRLMANLPSIDFIDTYSAGFLRDRFLEMNGYDMSFPVACAEDVELSYRMSSRGWLMKFVPQAIVYHTHPATFSSYLKKKYKFAFWRILAVRKNPAKGVKDSHTPQIMKLQLLFVPALLLSILFDLLTGWRLHLSGIVVLAFLLSTLPFALRVLKKDPLLGVLSPFLLAARSCAQMLGVAAGMAYVARHSRTQVVDAR